MQFYGDSFFHIGQTHLTTGKPCQDYALAEVGAEVAYALVADGCSSGERTDIGARIVALTTLTAMKQTEKKQAMLPAEQFFPQVDAWREQSLMATQSLLGVTPLDLLATCVSVMLTPGGGYVRIEGDGVVAIKYHTGAIRMFRFDWNNNMPFYPTYRTLGLQLFVKAHGGVTTEECLREEVWLWDSVGQCVQEQVRMHSVQDGLAGIKQMLEAEELAKEVTCVAVFSDGVCQIDGVDWQDAVREFLAFKNMAGEFAKRRMIRGIKDLHKIGRGPMDDIAYAVIRVEAQQEEENNEDGKFESAFGRT
ncbi:MAG: protein phosphatase 2C domain-containing protein [Parcubacteria group bacterium]